MALSKTLTKTLDGFAGQVQATNAAGVQVTVNERFNAQETGQVRIVNAGTATVHLGEGL